MRHIKQYKKSNLGGLTLKKKFYSLIAILLSIIIFMPLTYAQPNKSISEIRIRLTNTYNVPTINIYNKISMGYIDNQQWVSELNLDQNENYIFSPLTNYWIESNQIFNDYLSAYDVCKVYNSMGCDSIPTRKGKKNWVICIGSFKTNLDANNHLIKINKINDKINFKLSEKNSKKYKMVTKGNILAIVDGTISYPQYAPIGNSDTISLGDRRYRGRIEIGNYENKGLGAINQINIEDYLLGVLPSEMIPSWPIESLKAQAVACRTYALYYIYIGEKYINKPYQLCDTQYSQVYKGYNVENPNTTKAVLDTKGQVISYNDKLIEPFYFSTSGGHTENSENVWLSKLPYIKAIPDIHELNPETKPWVKEINITDIEQLLFKHNIGDVVDLEVRDYSKSGRVMTLAIIGTKGVYKLTKEEIKTSFNLKSRKFKLVKENSPSNIVTTISSSEKLENIEVTNNVSVINDNNNITPITVNNQIVVLGTTNINNYPIIKPHQKSFIFAGQGNGHGVGMSQSGAHSMALKGYNYIEILDFYYNNIKVHLFSLRFI